MSDRGCVLLALKVLNKIRHDWYWAMKIKADEAVFDKLRCDLKGDRVADCCELINLYFARTHNVRCANPMALLQTLENNKAKGIIPDMEENDDDILEDIK